MLKNLACRGIQAIVPKPILFCCNYATNHPKNKAKIPTVPGAEEIRKEDPIGPAFLVHLIGSFPQKWSSVLEKHPELKTVTRQNISNSVKALKTLNYTTEDMLIKPMILFYNSTTIENRHSVLYECGFDPISISILFKYLTAMNKSVSTLKSHCYIPYDMDVFERLRMQFTDVDLKLDKPPNYEDMELKHIRQLILNSYLRQRLDTTEADLEKLWKSYSRIRNRSFRAIQTMITLLTNELNFSKERIVKNGFLLYGEAENVRRILKEIPKIGEQDIKDIGYRRPKVLMSNCDSLLKTLQHVKTFGINENAINRCLEVLTLGPDTVLERLKDLNEIKEFEVLGTNPRVLRLIHYQNKARLRLEYLNQLKVRCASLHILSCGSETFAKFARDGSDRTKGRDIVVFLANVMERDENDIRSLMSRHPNWCHIPATHVKQCFEFLLSKKFTIDNIYNNIHLLLYPLKRIEEKIFQLYSNSDPLFLSSSIQDLNNDEILTLILYLIECEFHFTGDGIWTEQHSQQVENFSNLLPDFPEASNKVYKYGVKPAGSRKLDTKQVIQVHS